MNTQPDPLQELVAALGDHRSGGRADGVWDLRWSGPASVPGLNDLAAPELALELLPDPPSAAQLARLAALGYQPELRAGEQMYVRAGGPHLRLLSHDLGQPHDQRLLWEHLRRDAAARDLYRQRFVRGGRAAADLAALPVAQAAHVRATGFGPLREVAALLADLPFPWMFAGGWALDLHLNQPSRPHEDIDVVVSAAAQTPLRALLAGAGLRGWAVRDGAYTAWDTPLESPHYQVHVHREGGPMLDLMLSDLSGGQGSGGQGSGGQGSGEQWHYRRDPAVTLPLERVRRRTPDGWPYLAPEVALLFKSGARRPRDQQDAERALPHLTAAGRGWLAARLGPDHPWQARLLRP